MLNGRVASEELGIGVSAWYDKIDYLEQVRLIGREKVGRHTVATLYGWGKQKVLG